MYEIKSIIFSSKNPISYLQINFKTIFDNDFDDMKYLLLLLNFFVVSCAYGQVETEVPQDIIEDFIQNNGEDIDFDQNTLFENLEKYIKNPLNLTTTTEYQLKEMGILSDIQINSLLNHIRKNGPIISKYELQSVAGWDITTIKRFLPFVQLPDEQQYNGNLNNILDGRNNVFLRWTRVLQQAKGYQTNPTTGKPNYIGSPDRFYFRFHHSNDNKITYGVVAEKDPGEAFFKTPSKYGFDFYSAHFQINNFNKTVKSFVIGDFVANFGQGLLCWQSFAPGKSAFVNTIKRGGKTIKPYTAVNEAQFFRGIATTLAFNKNWEVTVFASHRFKDGNLSINSEDPNSPEEIISSRIESGLHRTEAEIADKNALQETTFGSRLLYTYNKLKVGANALYTNYNKSFFPSPQPYNIFYFRGKSLMNGSVDYSYIYRNFNFFGETAISDNGGIATVNSLLMALDRRVSLSMVYRNYAKDYQQVQGQAFGETSQMQNEKGFYAGLEIVPFSNWKVSIYSDFWKHPWLRYQVDFPSVGNEHLIRLTYTIRRKWECYLQYRTETKERNSSIATEKYDYLTNVNRSNIRLHSSFKIQKTMELRTRAEWSFYTIDNQTENGFMIYQDILYKPISSPFSFTTRLAFFDTKSYNTRIYAYENDILNSFSVPPFYNRGTRFYLTLRYKVRKFGTIEARYAVTQFDNVTSIGSGTEEINGNLRSEVKLQTKITF